MQLYQNTEKSQDVEKIMRRSRKGAEGGAGRTRLAWWASSDMGIANADSPEDDHVAN
jgi:hypothetical protein